jgi:hypothetical protein
MQTFFLMKKNGEELKFAVIAGMTRNNGKLLSTHLLNCLLL